MLGRPLLARHPSIRVTAWSFLWGLVTTAPLAAVEWQVAARSPWTATSVAAVLYLGVVMTGLGYLVWNWALERVSAARAAIYLNVQPLVGTLLGVVWLGEPLSAFTVAGGCLVVLGLWLALTGRPASADPPGPRRRRASANTASNIGQVSRPVCVFWRLG